jgi:hypothetical protein
MDPVEMNILFHTSRSRRREEAEVGMLAGNPPPHVGGYYFGGYNGRRG